MNTKNTARKGFTTVELVIVIAVIAILATVLIPTFSNLIEKANLSSDKQNVRNMNICLTTEIASKIKADKPEDFGAVKELLKEYGYGKDDNFIAKTKGHSIRWFIDDTNGDKKSVIVLVNAENIVVFPEEYKDKNINASDIRKFFDLSLPAATITIKENPKVLDDKGNETEEPIKVDGIPLSVLYTFEADLQTNTNYGNWVAEYYVAVDLPENSPPVTLTIAGEYGTYGWMPITEEFPGDVVDIPLLETYGLGYFTYSLVQSQVAVFHCGVVGDEEGGADQGVKLTVELRLTKSVWSDDYGPEGGFVPKDGGEQKVLGIFEYVYK